MVKQHRSVTPAGSPISLRCFQLGNLEFCLGLGDCAQLCTVIRAGGRDGTKAQGGQRGETRGQATTARRGSVRTPDSRARASTGRIMSKHMLLYIYRHETHLDPNHEKIRKK